MDVGQPLRAAGSSGYDSRPTVWTATRGFYNACATLDITVRDSVPPGLRASNHSIDTLRTHVKGLLISKPEWKADLVDFQVEGAWNAGAWEEVRSLVADGHTDSSQLSIAKVLIALQANDREAMHLALDEARMLLGDSISAAGPYEYRRSYESALNLHALYEIETVYTVASTLASGSRQRILATISRTLRLRLDATQPSYRVREPLLSMRRVVFGLW